MKVALITDALNRPASELALTILQNGFGPLEDVHFEVLQYCDLANWRGEIALLMGYDARASDVRDQAPQAIVGVIDPRPRQKLSLKEVDFLLPNGFESWQQWRSFGVPQELFFLLELAKQHDGSRHSRERFSGIPRLGYLGNKVHLKRLKQVAGDFLFEAALDRSISINVYLSDHVSERDKSWLPPSTRFFKLGEDPIEDFLNETDVGLIPQLRPRQTSDRVVSLVRRLSKDRNNVVDLNFKPTTNPGRILTFAQFGIPVIVESTPSATYLLGNDFRKFIVFDSAGWEDALRSVIAKDDQLPSLSTHMSGRYRQMADPASQARRILDCASEIIRDRVV